MSISKTPRRYLERKGMVDRRTTRPTYRMLRSRSHRRPVEILPVLQPEDRPVDKLVTIPDEERRRFLDD